ncbi:MAG: CDP-alcohol phosphatidyltransferase family protein [Candidatus Neomarinimicrobiota bacterium]|jgi:phosphatidylcholine synthase
MLKKSLAHSVHFFTILGVYFSYLALEAAIEKNLNLVFLYLAIALFIDGVDGTLARWADVKTYASKVNGEILDNIIDFLSYVFIPAFVIHTFSFVPEEYNDVVVFLILVTSCYTFSNNDLKTKDNYFSGFPALWNIVLLYFYILETSQVTNFWTIIALSIMTFIPVKFLHPFRVRNYRTLNLSVLIIWIFSSFALLLEKDFGVEFLLSPFWFWIGSNIYFIFLTLFRTTELN